MDSDAHTHPSYDTLFFPVMSQENLSAADYEFEERQREHALKSLIEDMTIWESLDPSRNKVYSLHVDSAFRSNRRVLSDITAFTNTRPTLHT